MERCGGRGHIAQDLSAVNLAGRRIVLWAIKMNTTLVVCD